MCSIDMCNLQHLKTNYFKYGNDASENGCCCIKVNKRCFSSKSIFFTNFAFQAFKYKANLGEK